MGNIYLTSDLHFNHQPEFIWKSRGYESVSQMNERQIEKWNAIITDEDDVYVLGDSCLGGGESLDENRKLMEQLKGKLHIVLGNHDTARREAMYRELPNVVEVAEVGIRLKYKKHNFVLTHFPMLAGNLEIEALRQTTLNLYGHTHQTTNFYNDMPYNYHVGVDSHNGYPVLLDDIIEEMYAKVEWCKAQLDLPEEEEDFETLLRQHEELTEKISNHPEFEKILDAFNTAGTGSCGGNCDTCAGCN